MNTVVKTGCIALVAIASAVGLSACAGGDGYGSSYSSFSVGVASDPYYDGYGYRGYRGYRAHGDRDGDGVPNWADRSPRNPWRD